MERHDAVVLGGGPAGTAFAITLAAAGRSVVVLDRSAPPANCRGGDVLPPEARPLLEELGVWERFRSGGHLASSGMLSGWGGEELVAKDFVWSPFGDAWHVDRNRFDEMLVSAAETAGATVHRATRPTAANTDGQSWRVEAVSNDPTVRLRADFVVEATGRSSSLARPPVVQRRAFDRLVGVVVTVAATASANGADPRMLLEATESGWWYSAPIPGARLVVAWMTDPDVRGPAPGFLRERWPLELERTLHTRARVPADTVASPSVVAANSCWRRAAHERWVAVGDAAASYDPLSGQGVVRALQTGLSAAVAVMAAQDGRVHALDDYADGVAEDFRQYLRLRQEYYRAEQRWPASTFWRRRHAPPAPVTLPS
jgi:2-polyprenyl-6-methoxyphenol hydroxylase-like FAD-dependent oxidoreductase